MVSLADFFSYLPESLWLKNFWGYYKIELLLLVILLLLFILLFLFLNQRSRYQRLKKWIKRNAELISSQESFMQALEGKINKIQKSEEGLDYWSRIRGELGELSQLPSLEEQENEFILKAQLSKLKKDDTDVTATSDEIKISVYSDRIPLKCAYSLPSKINPNKLTITYKGNTLEIRAKKA